MKKIIFAVVILFGLNVNAAIYLNGQKIDRVENKAQFKKLEKICFEASEKGKQINSNQDAYLFFSYDNQLITLILDHNTKLPWFHCTIQDVISNSG